MNDENRRLKIALVTSEDPKSKRSWSGITYHMAQALQKHCGDVYNIGPIKVAEKRIVARMMHETSKRLFKKNIAVDRLTIVARKHAKVVEHRVAGQSFDVIVAPIGTPEIAFLQTDIPIMIVEGATFHQLHDYYPQYSQLVGRFARQAYQIESMAYKKASALIFPSEWAARSAIEDVHIEERKVHVVPHGANFEEIPPREIAFNKKKSGHCKLLFVGIFWERKGGAIAFETLLKLEEMGIQAELIVCGCVPPQEFAHEKMTVIPFLDKSDPGQRNKLEELYASADFLILPTRRECFGLVFCEASAYGLPSITTDTGGVPGAVKDGLNGFTLPLTARGKEYARVIAEVYQNDQRYNDLVRSSRALFEDRLNWDSWGMTARKILSSIASPPTMDSIQNGLNVYKQFGYPLVN